MGRIRRAGVWCAPCAAVLVILGGPAGTVHADPARAPSPSVRTVAAASSTVRGLWHFDEKSGSTAADSSGNGHNGKITGATLGLSGLHGTSFGFHQDAAKVLVASSADLNPGTSDFEVTLHVNLDSAPGKGQTADVFRKGLSYTSGGEFKLELYGGGHVQCIAKDSKKLTATVKYTATNVADGAWHTLGCRLVGSTWSVIVDGKAVSKHAAFGSISNSKPISIGSKYGQEDGVRGRIDEVRYSVG